MFSNAAFLRTVRHCFRKSLQFRAIERTRQVLTPSMPQTGANILSLIFPQSIFIPPSAALSWVSRRACFGSHPESSLVARFLFQVFLSLFPQLCFSPSARSPSATRILSTPCPADWRLATGDCYTYSLPAGNDSLLRSSSFHAQAYIPTEPAAPVQGARLP